MDPKDLVHWRCAWICVGNTGTKMAKDTPEKVEHRRQIAFKRLQQAVLNCKLQYTSTYCPKPYNWGIPLERIRRFLQRYDFSCRTISDNKKTESTCTVSQQCSNTFRNHMLKLVFQLRMSSMVGRNFQWTVNYWTLHVQVHVSAPWWLLPGKASQKLLSGFDANLQLAVHNVEVHVMLGGDVTKMPFSDCCNDRRWLMKWLMLFYM